MTIHPRQFMSSMRVSLAPIQVSVEDSPCTAATNASGWV